MGSAAAVPERREVGREVEATKRRLSELEETLLLHAAATAVGGQALTQTAADLVRRAVLGGPLPLPGCSCRGAAPVTLRYGSEDSDAVDLRIDGRSPEHLVAVVDALLSLRDAVLGLSTVPPAASADMLAARLTELRARAAALISLSLEVR